MCIRMILVVLFTLFALTGCDINPSKYGAAEAQEFTESITYVKDNRTGLCFALVASRKSGELSQSGMGISQVPCNIVQEFLGK